MKTLIIGAGEIGRSLKSVLEKKHEVWMMDKDEKMEGPVNAAVSNPEQPFDILNICYPPSAAFVSITKTYIAKYKPKVTIIHSTVAPGTTEKCGEMVVHSPVHGKHPNLGLGIKTYIKYLGGNDPFAVQLALEFLMGAGIKVRVVASSKTSELSKILCTTAYGWNIVFMKEVAKICKKYGVPFGQVYTNWTSFYNEGNDELGLSDFNRPILIPVSGKIGGHCVVENCHLLSSDITDFIIKKNDEYKK